MKNAEEVSIGEKYYCGANIGKFNYEEGKAACQAMNGRLPLPRNKIESKDIMNFALKQGVKQTIHLGAENIESSGKFEDWVDDKGEKLSFSNWNLQTKVVGSSAYMWVKPGYPMTEIWFIGKSHSTEVICLQEITGIFSFKFLNILLMIQMTLINFSNHYKRRSKYKFSNR